MTAALALARRGLGRVAPNPAVGCVLVGADGRVVGRGWTQPGGRPHAEAEALARAGGKARGATAYVTLEPCAHTGETPPCADALISAGVARVVAAIEDPDPRTAGRGLRRLREAGIATESGVEAAAARVLNRGFLARVTRGRPLFTLKTATTLDGRIATRTGDSQWITGPEARAHGHLARATHDAVLTGIGTVLADDPALTCRLPGMAAWSPSRIVLDGHLRTPPGSALAASAGDVPVLVLTADGHDAAKADALRGRGVEIATVAADDGGRLDPVAIARVLGERGLTRVLIEAGAQVSAAFMAAGLVDRILWFRAAKAIGGDGLAALGDMGIATLAEAATYERESVVSLGPDTLETYVRPFED